MAFLAITPGAGHSRENLTDEPVKFWPVFSYLIIYDPATQPIGVARVLHGGQDLTPIDAARTLWADLADCARKAATASGASKSPRRNSAIGPWTTEHSPPRRHRDAPALDVAAGVFSLGAARPRGFG